jgi:AcrR family transcriptional regulator
MTFSTAAAGSPGPTAARAVERSATRARARAEAEVRALVEAGLAALRRSGSADLTVADVLSEAGLSTRAFYRHFSSKDELLLAVYEEEARASHARLARAVEASPSPRAAFEAWVDETLALAYDPRRAKRTRVLAAEGRRAQAEHPERFDAIVDGVLEPLRAVLAAGRDDGTFPLAEPDVDARTVHVIAWAAVEARLAGSGPDLGAARARVLRFCLPALGATS